MTLQEAEDSFVKEIATYRNKTIDRMADAFSKQAKLYASSLEKEIKSLEYWNNEKQIEEEGNRNSFAVAEAEIELEKKLREEFDNSTKDMKLKIFEQEAEIKRLKEQLNQAFQLLNNKTKPIIVPQWLKDHNAKQ